MRWWIGDSTINNGVTMNEKACEGAVTKHEIDRIAGDIEVCLHCGRFTLPEYVNHSEFGFRANCPLKRSYNP